MGEWITIEALGGVGSFAAWLSRPAGAPTAALVLVQEIFGVNRSIRQVAEDWSAKGYLVIAPDMAWRFAPRFEADPEVPEQLDRAMALRERLDPDAAIADVEMALRHSRDLLDGGVKAGVIGYCWGGTIAYLAATRCDADASVGYYGRQIVDHLGEAHAIARPLLLHFGCDDPTIPAEIRQRVHAALDPHPQVTIHHYDGAGHGFAAPFGARRNPAAAAQADEHSVAFLANHLTS